MHFWILKRTMLLIQLKTWSPSTPGCQLCFMKKAISQFMPRKRLDWDPIQKEGNPTRSSEVNELIKRVMKFEVRREGVKSHARRPIEYEEFLNLLKLIITSDSERWRSYWLGSIITLQWHMVARIDDMMKLKFDSLSYNPQHNFTLICKMRW